MLELSAQFFGKSGLKKITTAQPDCLMDRMTKTNWNEEILAHLDSTTMRRHQHWPWPPSCCGTRSWSRCRRGSCVSWTVAVRATDVCPASDYTRSSPWSRARSCPNPPHCPTRTCPSEGGCSRAGSPWNNVSRQCRCNRFGYRCSEDKVDLFPWN